MKRRKSSKIILGLLLVVIVLGIGYATITGINLLVNGTATLKPNGGNFKVRFVKNDVTEDAILNAEENAITIIGHNADETLMDVSGMSATVVDDTHATFGAGELDIVGEYVEFTYTVVNDSDELNASLSFDVDATNDAEEYFEITKTVSKEQIAINETATVTVKVELINTPKVNDAHATFTVTLSAMPVEGNNDVEEPSTSDDPIEILDDLVPIQSELDDMESVRPGSSQDVSKQFVFVHDLERYNTISFLHFDNYSFAQISIKTGDSINLYTLLRPVDQQTADYMVSNNLADEAEPLVWYYKQGNEGKYIPFPGPKTIVTEAFVYSEYMKIYSQHYFDRVIESLPD